MHGSQRTFAVLGLSVVALVGSAALAPAKSVRGTQRPDFLVGTRKADRIGGRSGGDRVSARSGDDTVVGGRGGDRIGGGPGDDRVTGNRGSDLLYGGFGFDELIGGSGKDVIRVTDGAPDSVDCGTGYDTVYVDTVEDGVVDCENVITP